jgi:hypothetical protein
MVKVFSETRAAPNSSDFSKTDRTFAQCRRKAELSRASRNCAVSSG